MTKIHFYEYVTDAPLSGIDTVEFPEAPVVGDTVQIETWAGTYRFTVRDRKWIVSESGEVHCRVFVVS